VKRSQVYTMECFFLCLVMFLHFGCLNDDQTFKAKAENNAASVAVNVRITDISLSTLNETLRLLGETQANIDITYSAEVSGRLDYLAVDYGDRVTKGQILARVDYEMLSAQAEQAEAAYDLALKTFNRLEMLLKDELVTQQRVDEAQAALIQSQAQLRQAQTALRHSIVKSTINGIVTRKFVQEGEYIMPGSPLLRVIDYSEIIITAQIPENRIADIHKGLRVSVWIDALRDTFSGTVDVVLPNADPESRTFTIRVRTPNTSEKILVGMAATLNIIVHEHTDVIVVPQDVIVEHSGERFVFIVEENTARKVPVTLGASEGHLVIVTSGLKTGDRLITEGHRDLVDGQPVSVMS
jgi:membrane fusion protein, multidrug efflux system